MKLRHILLFVVLIALAVFLSIRFGNTATLEGFLFGDSGVMCAGLFGFVGKAIKGVVGIAAKQVGIGGGSGRNIQVTTRQDPAIAANAQRQSATIDKLLSLQIDQANAKSSGNILTTKVLGLPLVGVLAVGGLAIGAIFILRKRR